MYQASLGRQGQANCQQFILSATRLIDQIYTSYCSSHHHEQPTSFRDDLSTYKDFYGDNCLSSPVVVVSRFKCVLEEKTGIFIDAGSEVRRRDRRNLILDRPRIGWLRPRMKLQMKGSQKPFTQTPGIWDG